MSAEYLEIARKVLDRQVVDSNLVACGKVDDIEIQGTRKLRVTALLVGNGAASGRLPELGKFFSRLLFGTRIVRIPWSEVSQITEQIKLKSTAHDLKLDERSGAVYSFISKLPGAWKK